ncbi:MAG: FliM/FliN family flagellar motor switch protein [Rhodobacteraceae bacterium]|nr:FliM/FliN family flagellar motor switch protein [Paracoccaceae bacterium]
MTLTTRDPVKRRKIVRRPPPDAGEGPPPSAGPGREIVRGFARAVSDCAPLVAEGGTRNHRQVSLAELLDTVDPDAFVGLLAPGGGIAVIDQSGFATLIEAMTVGRLSSRTPLSRRPTPTDAALLAEVIDATLAVQGAGDAARGLTLHRPVADHRLLAVLLEDGRYDRVTLDVNLVAGTVQRPARILVALPVAAPEAGVDPGPVAPEGRPAVSDDWGARIAASVMAAPASLRAELGRLTLPLSAVLDLGVGSALTLPLSNLEEVRLVALDGAVHAVGRLGQTRGMRAVRLTSWPNGMPGEAADAFLAREPLASGGVPGRLGGPQAEGA